ncbi:MAG: DNA-directed RNA polymerase subunit omega [Treponema sp.]|nr:DNA-directed RNA polymerase subunit omega [Treponema sp.]MCL2251856.1 DNA-directed RNA polymerase subunit omega [Treponema sp.]
MIFPLRDLIEYGDNMYEVTTAASHRAYQLSSVLEKIEKDEYDGKMVALAAMQVFTNKIQFRLESE